MTKPKPFLRRLGAASSDVPGQRLSNPYRIHKPGHDDVVDLPEEEEDKRPPPAREPAARTSEIRRRELVTLRWLGSVKGAFKR